MLTYTDVMFHRTHRHEPPVHGVIALVENAPDLVAVSKPASMPMHPCGSYHHNTLTHIIVNEPVIPNQPPLMLVHRLDRYVIRHLYKDTPQL
jgi:23S rRNA-/tRNA-specific pseudouridylate synthase